MPTTRIAAGMKFACDTYCFGQRARNTPARQHVTRIDSVIILETKETELRRHNLPASYVDSRTHAPTMVDRSFARELRDRVVLYCRGRDRVGVEARSRRGRAEPNRGGGNEAERESCYRVRGTYGPNAQRH